MCSTLTYTLLQWQFVRGEKAELNLKTLPRVREVVLPAAEQVPVFCRNCFALLSVLEYQEILLTLRKTSELGRVMYELPVPR